MRKTTYTAECLSRAYIGYTAEGIVCFEIDEAIKLIKDYNQRNKCQIYYSEDKDAFWQANTEDQTLYLWKGRNYKTAEGIKHLYNIEIGGNEND